MGDSPGILRSAYLHNVPVFVPTFTDSELGLDVATWMLRRTHKEHGNSSDFDPFEDAAAPPFNPFLDLLSYARLVRTRDSRDGDRSAGDREAHGDGHSRSPRRRRPGALTFFAIRSRTTLNGPRLDKRGGIFGVYTCYPLAHPPRASVRPT